MYELQQWRQVRFITFYGNLLELNYLLYKNIWFSLYHNHLARYASCCPLYYLFARNLSIDNYLWTLNHERIELFLFRGGFAPVHLFQDQCSTAFVKFRTGAGSCRWREDQEWCSCWRVRQWNTHIDGLLGLFRLFRMTRSATHRTDLK